MDLKQLSCNELDRQNVSIGQHSRELLHKGLLHIQETDRRKLYLDFGYPNLFSYLTERCGYSANGAQRRIDAARLMAAVPEVGTKIETGEINLSHTSVIQKSIRQKTKELKKEAGGKGNTNERTPIVSNEREVRPHESFISISQKKEIVAKVLGKTAAQSQAIVAKVLDLDLAEGVKETHQKDESVRLEVTFTKIQWQKLIEMRDLLSTALHSNDWTEVFEYLSDKVIAQKRGGRLSEPTTKLAVDPAQAGSRKLAVDPAQAGSRKVVERQNRKHISVSSRRLIWQRDKGCRYKDKHTAKVCGSRWDSQIDHIQPIWAGGNNDLSNLQVLCGKHNRHRYKNQANIKTR